MLVVMIISLLVLALALPIGLSLLKEQKDLGTEMRLGEVFPIFLDRLERDLEITVAGGVIPPPPTRPLDPVHVILEPDDPEKPRIDWEFAGNVVTRREKKNDANEPDARERRPSFGPTPTPDVKERRFTLTVPVVVLVYEAMEGRLVLLAAGEVIALALPRPDQRVETPK
jgi:hypothetical protein